MLSAFIQKTFLFNAKDQQERKRKEKKKKRRENDITHRDPNSHQAISYNVGYRRAFSSRYHTFGSWRKVGGIGSLKEPFFFSFSFYFHARESRYYKTYRGGCVCIYIYKLRDIAADELRELMGVVGKLVLPKG